MVEPGSHGSPRGLRSVLGRLRGLYDERSVGGPRGEDRPRPSRRALAAGLATLVMCVVAGFMIGTSASLAKGTDLRGGRTTDMISMVSLESQRNAALAQQVSAARAEVDAIESGDSPVPPPPAVPPATDA